jgi:endoglucanase
MSAHNQYPVSIAPPEAEAQAFLMRTVVTAAAGVALAATVLLSGCGTAPNKSNDFAYYRNPDQSVYSAVQGMVNSGDYPEITKPLQKIEREPAATWLGEWLTDDVETSVHKVTTEAAAAHQMPVLVAYNIPDRDLGEHSAGGVSGPQAYKKWTDSVSAGIGDRPAVVVLEPDALPGVLNMPAEAGKERVAMLRDALRTYTAHNPNAYVYVDGGNSKWLAPDQLAALLKEVYSGVDATPRVSLNVSNYRPTSELQAYGRHIAAAYGDPSMKFILDTGLNGASSPTAIGDWCNPRSARHGHPNDLVFNPATPYEQLMIRIAGESSGECDRNDPAAGEFDPDLMATALGDPSGHYQ